MNQYSERTLSAVNVLSEVSARYIENIHNFIHNKDKICTFENAKIVEGIKY